MVQLQYAQTALMGSEGYTLFQHALESTDFLLTFCQDEDALLASLFQHLPILSLDALDTIEKEFGLTVRDLVSKVHLLSHLYTSSQRKSVDSLKSMIISLSSDARVLFIALSSTCIFLEHMELFPSAFQSKICRYTLELFAPIAARLGMYAVKYRLERTSFPRCYAADSERIAEQLNLIHREYGAFIHHTADAIRQFLLEHGISARVMSRQKQPYSVFCKLRDRSLNDPRKIVDLFAIRIIVLKLEDCYQALGFLHRFGTPLAHRFRDYISFPKPNNYQSLHTCILGLPHAPKDVIIEVQIRTEAMHQAAEYGVAAHWIYKETGRSASQAVPTILASQLSIEDQKSSRLVNSIYVLTPHGDIVELPKGSTPLDFAFHLHTDLGLRYRLAKVNGHPVSLSYLLENGDSIEIDLHKHPCPSLQWLEAVKTASARSKLKHYFASHDRAAFVSRGKDIVNAELRSRGLSSLDADLSVFALFDGAPLSLRDREDLLFKIGMGTNRVSSILRHLTFPGLTSFPTKKSTKNVVASVVTLDLPGLLIAGVPCTLPYRFAKCCAPQLQATRGSLVATIGREGALLIHDAVCKMGASAHSDRRLKVEWGRGKDSR
jgi:GTP pyrophosphokinase